MVKDTKSSHITPILRSLHWFMINERIEYKLLSLAYKVFTISQPDYLQNLISVQSIHVEPVPHLLSPIARPPVSSLLQIIYRSFGYASPYIWNHLSFFISSTSFCSLSSWFISSCAYHLITVTTFAVTICHSLGLLLQT